MKKRLIKLLSDPNADTGNSSFEVYGQEVSRSGALVVGLEHDQIDENDDIRTGFLFNRETGFAYPIIDHVLSMLSDEDADANFYLTFFRKAIQRCPAQYKEHLKNTIVRLENTNSSTESGQWNREEMQYYDAAVDSPKKRKRFLKTIHSESLWHIYLERKRYLVDVLDKAIISGSTVLEVGCGNARTIFWIFRPSENGYDYVGSDISFDRLRLARMVIPEGDFVQCSALNLPFRDESFSALFSFGVLHHLSDPFLGVQSCLRKIANSGYLLFQEPINKPTRFFSGNRLLWLKKRLESYEHSEHDNELEWQKTRDYLTADNNVTFQKIHFQVSVVRTVCAFLLGKFPWLNRRKSAWRLLILIDNFFLAVFCRRPNMFGPSGVLAAVRKCTESHENFVDSAQS